MSVAAARPGGCQRGEAIGILLDTRHQVEKLLYDVVKHYETGGIDRPSRSPLLQPLTPTEQERIDLVAFLPRRSTA